LRTVLQPRTPKMRFIAWWADLSILWPTGLQYQRP